MIWNPSLRSCSTEDLKSHYVKLENLQRELTTLHKTLCDDMNYGDQTPKWIHDIKEEILREIGSRQVKSLKEINDHFWT